MKKARNNQVNLKIWLKQNILFACSASFLLLLAFSYYSAKFSSLLSLTLLTLLSIPIIFYYVSLFLTFKGRIALKAREAYLLDLFSRLGASVFFIISILYYSTLGDVLDKNWPTQFFNGLGFKYLIINFITSILDWFLLTLPSTFNFQLLPQYESGVYGKMFLYFGTAISKLFIIGLLISLFIERNEVRKSLEKLFDLESQNSKKIHQIIFNKLLSSSSEPQLVSRNWANHFAVEGLKLYSKSPAISEEARREIISIIANTNIKEARDLALLIAEQTEDMEVFTMCVRFLKVSEHARLKRLSKMIVSEHKQLILSELLKHKYTREKTVQRTNR